MGEKDVQSRAERMVADIRELQRQEREGDQYQSHAASRELVDMLPEFLDYVLKLDEAFEFTLDWYFMPRNRIRDKWGMDRLPSWNDVQRRAEELRSRT